MKGACEFEEAFTTKEPTIRESDKHTKDCNYWKPEQLCDCEEAAAGAWIEKYGAVEMGLNAGYLADALSVCGDSAVLEWRDNQTQIVVRGEGVIAVVMPIRI
jgi:hypothetical protein